MNIVIGIISYLPDKNKEVRKTKLINLLQQCDELFKLPIIIIAQNWENIELPNLDNSKIIVYKYKNRLGITEARRALRNKFLELDYDYLIMLDDDILLTGPKEGFTEYLDQIYSHPNMYGKFKELTLQLFAISKEIFSEIDYPKGDPATGDFFEDMWLIMALEKLKPNKEFRFIRNKIEAEGNAHNDKDSTWYYGQLNKRAIGDNTRRMIQNA